MPTDSLDSFPIARQVKLPRLLLPGVFAFPPNRETLGGTSYFIVEKAGNILVDCPLFDAQHRQFLEEQGGIRWVFLSHRGAISPTVTEIQASFHCEIILQEQEAYLLPEVKVTTFRTNFTLNENLELIWTPGHSPGSSCLYYRPQNGILFTGRHLLPDAQGQLLPLRLAKTFHWGRQLESVAKLRDRFSSKNLEFICPGANTGFLRGKGLINNAYEQLTLLDLTKLRQSPTLL